MQDASESAQVECPLIQTFSMQIKSLDLFEQL